MMMPDTTPITSKQEMRIVDLSAAATRNATTTALEQVPLDAGTAQRKIIARGGDFQRMIEPDIAKIIASALNKLCGHRHQAADELERFYQEVLNMKIDLSGVLFPEKQGFPAYMAVIPGLNEDMVIAKICAHFRVKPYSWRLPIAQHIDRKTAQNRPVGVYVCAHGGTNEPDSAHLNKSYDDAVEMKMIFANSLEYLLMSGFHMWKYKKWMDTIGGTRTSSVWSDGSLVNGNWNPVNAKLYLGNGNRDNRNLDNGPREKSLHKARQLRCRALCL